VVSIKKYRRPIKTVESCYAKYGTPEEVDGRNVLPACCYLELELREKVREYRHHCTIDKTGEEAEEQQWFIWGHKVNLMKNATERGRLQVESFLGGRLLTLVDLK
jgi:hypothetical protein